MWKFFTASSLVLASVSSAYAENWRDLPSEIALVAPQLDVVTSGIAVPRLIHVTIEAGDNETKFTFRSIATSGEGEPACDTANDACLPNVRHPVELTMDRNGKFGPLEISAPSNDIYYAELHDIFASSDVRIHEVEGKWHISDGDMNDTVWRPISLKEASVSKYFVEQFGLGTGVIGQCVTDQMAEIWNRKSLSKPEAQFISAVTLLAEGQRSADTASTDRDESIPAGRFLSDVALFMKISNRNFRNADELLSAYPIKPRIRGNVDPVALADENFGAIRDASAYISKLIELFRVKSPKKREEIICRDVVSLSP